MKCQIRSSIANIVEKTNQIFMSKVLFLISWDYSIWDVSQLIWAHVLSRLKSVSFKVYPNKEGWPKNLSVVFTGEGMPRFNKFGCFENRKVWRFWNCQLYSNLTIFGGFVVIITKKNVVIFGTTLETTFFCKNRDKTVKNRPITI